MLFITFFVTFIPQHLTGRTYWCYLPLTLRSFQNFLLSTKSELALPNFNICDLSKSMMPISKSTLVIFGASFCCFFLFPLCTYASYSKRHSDYCFTWDAQWPLAFLSGQVTFSVKNPQLNRIKYTSRAPCSQVIFIVPRSRKGPVLSVPLKTY